MNLVIICGKPENLHNRRRAPVVHCITFQGDSRRQYGLLPRLLVIIPCSASCVVVTVSHTLCSGYHGYCVTDPE